MADSTSVNLFKVLSAALALQRADGPGRTVVVSERSNFPTDLYIAEATAAERGLELVLADSPEEIPALLDERCAVLMLTHVNYSTGRIHDMAALTRAAHEAGALTLWDLAHLAGAVPLQLSDCGADFAIGCGYKYLNGGPGAPAFVWVAPRHAERFRQPLSGWMGHAAPFVFEPGYRPAPDAFHKAMDDKTFKDALDKYDMIANWMDSATYTKFVADYMVAERESLTKLEIPGLWIFGANDGSIPADLSMQRLQRLKKSGHAFDYVLFSGLGHNNMPETFATATDWIKRRVK